MAGQVGDRQLYEVRHRVARLGLVEPTFFEGTATSAGTTTLTDTAELVNYADDRLIGFFLYVYSSTLGSGQERRVTDSVQSTGVITVPTMTAPTGTIKYEMHKGLRVKDYNAAIQQAIGSIRSYGKANVALVADTSLTMTNSGISTDYLYTVPSTFRYITKILYEESGVADVYDQEVPYYAWANSMEKKAAATASADATYLLRIDRRYWEPISGQKLRIIGGGIPLVPTADTDTIPTGMEEYVVHRAGYYLLSSGRAGQGADAQAKGAVAREFLGLAQEARGLMKHHTPPGSRPVPW